MVHELDLAIGALEMLLAAAALCHLSRLRWLAPWPLALGAFFLLRGIDRSGRAFGVEAPAALSFAADTILGSLLFLILVGHRRFVRRAGRALESAQLREAEYQRALTDYRILARHRLANPITAISGSINTLCTLDVDHDVRNQLLETIRREAERLANISLDPNGELAQEEIMLEPRPRDGIS
jgi:signal transduction histidine kinase